MNDAQRADAVAADHLRACPRCGDLSGPWAKRCETCAYKLTVLPTEQRCRWVARTQADLRGTVAS